MNWELVIKALEKTGTEKNQEPSKEALQAMAVAKIELESSAQLTDAPPLDYKLLQNVNPEFLAVIVAAGFMAIAEELCD